MQHQTHPVRQAEFPAEQDTESERRRKTRLMERFQSPSGLIEAHLVSARYDNAPEFKLALCPRTDQDIPDFNLVKAAGEEFAQPFKRTQNSDTLLLTPVRYQQILTVAHPFCRRGLTGNA